MLSLIKILTIALVIATLVNADTVDKANEKWLADCKVKSPCKTGELCKINKDKKQVCECPTGYGGEKCAQRDCPIVEYKGEAIVGKVFIDKMGVPELAKLEKLAKTCKVQVKVTRSFLRSSHPEDNNLDADLALFVGHGIDFELNDASGKLLCDKACLAKVPNFGSTANSKGPLLNDPVSCFLKGLEGKHSQSQPGRLQKQKYVQNSTEYQELLKAAQVGCELRKDLPQSPKSGLLGTWKLVGSENWEDFLIANKIGWWTRVILKALKPDVQIENTGKNWTISVTSTFKNLKTVFTEGVPFTSKSPIAGDHTDHIVVSEGKNKLIEEQYIHSKPPRKVHVVREFVKNQFVQTLTIGKVVCKRIYELK